MRTVTPYRLVFAAHGEVREAARRLEHESLVRGGTDRPAAFAPYADSSVFLAVLGASGSLAGMCRLIVPGPAGLKTLNDLDGAPWHADGKRIVEAAGIDLSRTWDVASFAVCDDPGGKVSAALCHGVLQAARVNWVKMLVAMLDDRSRRRLALVGLLPGPLPGLRRDAAPGRQPVWCRVADLLDVQRAANPDGYRLVAKGFGLVAVSLPTPAQLRVPTPVPAPAVHSAARRTAAHGRIAR